MYRYSTMELRNKIMHMLCYITCATLVGCSGGGGASSGGKPNLLNPSPPLSGDIDFDFTDLTSTLISSKIESNIVRASGFSGAQSLSIAGHGGGTAWQIDHFKSSHPDKFSISAQDENSLSVTFSTDGSKMFSTGYSSDLIHQFSLSTAFDLTTASYDNINFSVASEDGVPVSINFNADGTKMYMIGTTDTIYQYSLGTAFDLTTASYDIVSLSLVSEGPAPFSMNFNADGTKMYTLDFTNQRIYQYSLPTGYDLTGASYDAVSLLLSSQETQPTSFSFNNDGTKMFLLGENSDAVYQFSLSTAYDIATASYDTVNFSLSTESRRPYSLSFSTDGSRMFVLDAENDSVFQYSLSTGYDLRTASFDTNDFSVKAQDNLPYTFRFSTDGTKMFYLGSETYRIHQYSLSTAFEPSTASYDNVSLYVGGLATFFTSMSFSPDGTKMLLLASGTDTIYQYSLGTGFDLATASYDIVNFSVAAQDINPYSLRLNPDGTKMFVMGLNTNQIYQYSLSAGFDLSTASYDTVSFATNSVPRSLAFNTDGTKMYTLCVGSNNILEYDLSTPYDLTTATYNNVVFSVVKQAGNAVEIEFNSDGKKLYLLSYDKQTIYKYSLATGFDLDTARYRTDRYSVKSESSNTWSINFNTDGTKMFVHDFNNRNVFQYSLGTAYDAKTAIYDSVSFSVAAEDMNPIDIHFNPDGTKMYMVGELADTIYQYSLSTGFDLTTASYDTVSFSVATEDIYPISMQFNADGTKMYVLGYTNAEVYQYSLGTAYDLSTASYDTVSFSVLAQDDAPFSLFLKPDGTKMYISGSSDNIFQYSLGTAFDISTASYDNLSLAVSSGPNSTPSAIYFKPDGTRLLFTETYSASIYQLELGNGGYPEYRVCGDSSCSSVLYDWRRVRTCEINNGDYLQVRTNSSANTATEHEAILQFTDGTVNWSTTTAP